VTRPSAAEEAVSRQTPDARCQMPDARRQTPDARRQTSDVSFKLQASSLKLFLECQASKLPSCLRVRRVFPSCPRRGRAKRGVVGEESMLRAVAHATRCSESWPGEERSEGWLLPSCLRRGRAKRGVVAPLLPEEGKSEARGGGRRSLEAPMPRHEFQAATFARKHRRT
jgi:hypothetical protein